MRRVPVVVLVLLAGLAGCSESSAPEGAAAPKEGQSGESAQAGGAPPEGGGAPAEGGGGFQIPVEAVVLQPEALPSALRTVGTLRADEAVIVRPEVAGRIVRIHFEEGEPVAAGAPLFTLDDSVWRAELNEADANLVKAKRADARASELVQRNLIAKSEVDTVRAELGVSAARVASARAQLDKATIHAPFAGVLGLREVSVGAYVEPGQALVALGSVDPIEVDFMLPENEVAQLAVGQSIRLEVDAAPDRDFPGTISAIDPAIDVTTRSVKVRAKVPNAEHALRPGLFARINVGEGEGEALLLPEQAMLQDAQGKYVYRIVDGKAVRANLQLGRRVPGKIEVISGLNPGDQVITAGQSKPMMHEGADVAVMGETPPSGAPPAQASTN